MRQAPDQAMASRGFTFNSTLRRSFLLLVLLGCYFAQGHYYTNVRQGNGYKAALRCYDCSGKNCLKDIKAGWAGKCNTGDGLPKCFVRRDPNGLIYRGCADHKIWPPDLALDYNGCSTQGYGRWAKKNVIWCFCDTHECNVNIEGVAAMYGGIRGRPEQRQAPARIYRDFPRQMPPRLEEITFYKPKAPPFQPIRYMPRPPQQVGPRVRYVNYNDGRQGPRFDNDVGPPQTTPPPRPRRTTPRATEEPADNQYETGTPEGKKGPKNEDDYENVLELIERLMRSPKDREFLDLGPGGNKIPPKDDLEGKDDSHTCQNMQCQHECRILHRHPVCVCPVGHKLLPNERNCTDINECKNRNGGCSHNCTNTIGSYYCSCPSGYVLDSDKRTCYDFNECLRTEDNNCQHTCRNKAGSFMCECGPGYTLNSDGKTCDDINECKTGQNKCSHTCENTEGSYICGCKHGYYLHGNKQTCRDTNECQKDNGGCKQRCRNTAGAFTCYCDKGYVMNVDGITCDDVDECLVNRGGCEHDCENTVGSYRCRCRTGFQLDIDQHKCIDVNECKIKNGGCDHICENTKGSYRCSCRSGYSLNVDLRSCNAKDKCANNNGGCQHFCTSDADGIRCSCKPGFMLKLDGRSCADFDECDEAGCDGGCFTTSDGSNCFCAPGFVLNNSDRRTCDDINECNTDNGGCSQRCSNTLGSYTCLCRQGFELNVDKRTCDDINECRVNKGGCDQQCENTPGSYRCKCDAGYAWDYSQSKCMDVDECRINRGGCQQKCTNNIGSFKCSCDQILFKLHTDGRSCEATCPGDFIKSDSLKSCYKIFTPIAGDGTAKSVPEAHADCKNRHERAGLASIQTADEQKYLARILRRESRNKKEMLEGWQGWWTSGVWHSGRNQFQWSDGTSIGIDSPHWGFQKQPLTDTCIWVLQISVYNQTWGNYDCLTKTGHICEIELP